MPLYSELPKDLNSRMYMLRGLQAAADQSSSKTMPLIDIFFLRKVQ